MIDIATMGMFKSCCGGAPGGGGAPPYRPYNDEKPLPLILVKSVEVKTINDISESIEIKLIDD